MAEPIGGGARGEVSGPTNSGGARRFGDSGAPEETTRLDDTVGPGGQIVTAAMSSRGAARVVED